MEMLTKKGVGRVMIGLGIRCLPIFCAALLEDKDTNFLADDQ